jgi:hypothetical protein
MTHPDAVCNAKPLISAAAMEASPLSQQQHKQAAHFRAQGNAALKAGNTQGKHQRSQHLAACSAWQPRSSTRVALGWLTLLADAVQLYTQALAAAPQDTASLSNRSLAQLLQGRPLQAAVDALAVRQVGAGLNSCRSQHVIIA